MNTIAIVLLEDLTVPYTYQSIKPRQADFGGIWGSSIHSVHVVVPEGLRQHALKGILVDGTYSVIEDEEKLEKLINEEWTKLRAERNRRLSLTDWTMLIDAPISTEEKKTYIIYRQALRDIPQQTSDPFHPEWPMQPVNRINTCNTNTSI